MAVGDIYTVWEWHIGANEPEHLGIVVNNHHVLKAAYSIGRICIGFSSTAQKDRKLIALTGSWEDVTT